MAWQIPQPSWLKQCKHRRLQQPHDRPRLQQPHGHGRAGAMRVWVGPGNNDWIYREACSYCGHVVKRSDWDNGINWQEAPPNWILIYELTLDPARAGECRSIILCTGCGGSAFRSLQRDRITQVQRQRPQGPGLSRCQVYHSTPQIVPPIVPYVHNGPVPLTPV